MQGDRPNFFRVHHHPQTVPLATLSTSPAPEPDLADSRRDLLYL